MFRGSISIYVRLFVLLAFVVTALLPMAVMADGPGTIEPPVQEPYPDPPPPDDGLGELGAIIISASLLLT